MRFDAFSFGSITIDGVTYPHDVVIAHGQVRKRKKKPSKKFRAPDAKERAAMEDLVARLRALPAGADAETIQNEVFEVGKAAGFEPLRAWFGALYEVLLGQSQGPRFGSFVAIFGIERTIQLIEKALAGELAA